MFHVQQREAGVSSGFHSHSKETEICRYACCPSIDIRVTFVIQFYAPLVKSVGPHRECIPVFISCFLHVALSPWTARSTNATGVVNILMYGQNIEQFQNAITHSLRGKEMNMQLYLFIHFFQWRKVRSCHFKISVANTEPKSLRYILFEIVLIFFSITSPIVHRWPSRGQFANSEF